MSDPVKTVSSEAKELSLISKVELRIALADTDSELKGILKTFLPPLLLKLASEHLNVRNKVRTPRLHNSYEGCPDKYNSGRPRASYKC